VRVTRRRRLTPVAAAGLLAAALAVAAGPPASAGDGGGGTSGYVDGANDGESVTGNATEVGPGAPGTTTRRGNGQPNCTLSDGTPAYLRYDGLQFTTMEEQRTEIRPEEQRPGVYLHIYCGDEWQDFRFFPDQTPVDPRVLAEAVRITPPTPVIHTSPAPGDHLVDVVAWFWVEDWGDLGEGTSAGGVSVSVTATPTSVLIDPGDGSAPFTCTGQPPAYAPGADPATGCTYTYQTAGEYQATATVSYETGFSSNIGVGGALGAIDVTGAVDLAVREAQAVVTE
jgi:hypothetical protein